MLLSFLLLLLALLSLGLALLTVFRVPVWVNWRLALLAGEFGWCLSVVPLLVGWIAWSRLPDDGAILGPVAAMSGLAVGLLMLPVARGWWMGRNLTPALTRAFGAAPPRPASSPGPVQTHDYAPGLALDFYPVRRTDGRPSPCVVMVHGGGWDAGDRAQLAVFNRRLARMGYAVAAISYRLAPKHPWPAQREDTLAAVAWLKARAADLGIDPTRLVLAGRSAGGQIATAVGYLGDPAVRGVMALYAPHDMRFAWSVSREDDALNSLKLMRQFLGGPPEGRDEIYDSASGQALVRPGRTPPTLLVHGTIDTLVWVRHSRRLAARLDEAGVPHFLLELPWATHACEFTPRGPAGRLTTRAVAHFLAAVTQ
ncbi:MAG: alpha/beta hydrolase [Opitutaceae bacterium]|nr:alpha/beta hydrolase [Opitutaceae bacterium]